MIESLEYLFAEQVPVIPDFKYTVVDVKCTDQQGRIFVVEMQIQWTVYFMERMLFNSSKAYVHQLQKGEHYNLLMPVYGLALLGGNFDTETENWYHHYKIVNIEKPKRVLDGLQLVFIELAKFKSILPDKENLQNLWMRFLTEINERTHRAPPELLAVPEIREALELLEESAYSRGELEFYDKYWDAVSKEKTLLSASYDEGLEKGLERGLERGLEKGLEKGLREGQLKIVRALQASGLELKEMSRLTQLPVEVLQALI